MGLLDKLFKGGKKKSSCCQFEVEEIKDEKLEKQEEGNDTGEKQEQDQNGSDKPNNCCS